MKPDSAAVHVLEIKPDMGGDYDSPPDSEPDADDAGGNYEQQLGDAYDAWKDDDKEGFISSMKAAIKACMSEDYEEQK